MNPAGDPLQEIRRLLAREASLGYTNLAADGGTGRRLVQLLAALPRDGQGALTEAWRERAGALAGYYARAGLETRRYLHGRLLRILDAAAAQEPARASSGDGQAPAPAAQEAAPAAGGPRASATAEETAAAPASSSGSEPALQRPLQYLKGVGPRRAERLAALGIEDAWDLLHHFPRTYEAQAGVKPVAEVQEGERVAVVGRLAGIEHRRPRRGFSLVRALIGDGSGMLPAVWYNSDYLLGQLESGSRIALLGDVERYRDVLQLRQPEFQLLDDDEAVPNAYRRRGLVPVYDLTAGITQSLLRRLVRRVLAELGADELPEFLPPRLLAEQSLPPRRDAYPSIHFPASREEADAARGRFAFEECFLLQLALLDRKARYRAEHQGHRQQGSGKLVARYVRALPFRLTAAQRRVIRQIFNDMARPEPMNRLLQGDVGSGKTVVAVCSLLRAVESGYQGVIMAPTEILAEQHAHHVREALAAAAIELEVLLLTGGLPPAQRREHLDALAAGDLHLAVGTHALLEPDVQFRRLGLVITDEQHRFGVRQRARLAAKGGQPDVLVMTATPIPRTLAITYYGDLDLSIIDELPPGRRPVKTRAVPAARREAVYAQARAAMEQGEQVYVVAPLIEPSEEVEAPAAVRLHAELAAAFPTFGVGLLHGGMSSDEKAQTMEAFRTGELQLLVSTTVIEVGLDVPEATVMIVEGAERFGLAQLHQLRGRVGRGERPGRCFLVAGQRGQEAERRLRVLERVYDGFTIAEEDLALRGPGELLGTRQHGLPDFLIADLARDAGLFRRARELAAGLLERDPDLQAAEHRALALELRRRHARLMTGMAG